jgi:hypothetical protein
VDVGVGRGRPVVAGTLVELEDGSRWAVVMAVVKFFENGLADSDT